MNYPQIAAAVYQRCNHYDPYLPPLSNDLARAWGSRFEKHRIDEHDGLAAVDAIYETHGNGDRPMAADIIDAVRAIRNDRYERETRDERNIRQRAHDSKAADAIHALAAGVVIGPTPIRTPRLVAAKAALQTCHGRDESMAAIREYSAAKRKAKAEAARAGEISAAIAKRRCGCGRDILDGADTCDRCQPVVNGPTITKPGKQEGTP